MRAIALAALVLAGCGRPAPTNPATEEAQGLSSASCNADCTSSLTCRDIFSSCRFCSLGVCSNTLPADPKPDAGVDAPGTTN